MPYVNHCCLIFRSDHIYCHFAFQCYLLYVGLSSLLFFGYCIVFTTVEYNCRIQTLICLMPLLWVYWLSIHNTSKISHTIYSFTRFVLTDGVCCDRCGRVYGVSIVCNTANILKWHRPKINVKTSLWQELAGFKGVVIKNWMGLCFDWSHALKKGFMNINVVGFSKNTRLIFSLSDLLNF